MMVFITIPWFTPAFRAGGPVQSVHNLVSTFAEGVEYRIFCGNKDLNGEALPGVKTDEWVPFNEYTQVWYASSDISRALTAQVEKLAPDHLFIIGIFSWHYNLVPLFFCRAPVKILSARGMLHPGALAQKKWKKKIYLALLKMIGISKKIVFHATDKTEEGFIKNIFGEKSKVAVAENYGRKISFSLPLHKEPGTLKLVTIALIGPMKNHLRVLEALAANTNRIEYNIYGPVKDAAYWQLCEAQIKLLPKNISVHYHGAILPAEAEIILAQNHVFIMPSESENFGHALYEALSAGRPVITGHNTPRNGLLAAKAGMNVKLNELNEAINFFSAMDNDEYKIFAAGAKSYIESCTDNDRIAMQYRKLFSQPQ